MLKVGDGSTLSQVELVLDLDGKGIAGPGLLKGFPGIPVTQGGVGELGEEGDDVKPGQLVSRQLTGLRGGAQLGSRLLPKLAVWAVLGEELHVFEVANGKPFHVREGGAKISGKVLDDLSPPFLTALALQNIAAQIVIELDLLGIGGQQGALASPLS